ncbi:WG repeat-containing protein [Marivirga arenosa]|uniref:WG repeat-containing protein n=1 Tax=Marivirga arenosa TaxID=3059076 RepID=A0AA51N478_9BACT|nr:WG repeat-containing protein [Marivirga sp. ABR2-2]WMN06026.1 WG repeat-containing protein [Marivirga sp. ABR2-2]
MTKLLYIFLIPWTLFAYASQGQAYAEFPYDSTLEIFSQSGKKGIKNKKGSIILKPEYQDFGWSNGYKKAIGNSLGYQQNDLWGLMDNELNIITKPQFKSLTPFTNDLFITAEKSKYSKVIFYGLIKPNGRSKIKSIYRNLYPAANYLIAANKDKQTIYFGVLDADGKTVIPFKYFHIEYLNKNNFIVTKNNGSKELIKLNPKPELLLSNIDSVSTFKDGVAVVFKNGKQGLIRQDGKLLLPIEYKKIEWNEGKQIYVTPLDEWTAYKSNGIKLSKFYADSVFYLNDSLLVKNTSSFAQISNIVRNENHQVFHAKIKGVFGEKFILEKSNQIFLAKDSSEIHLKKFSTKTSWTDDLFIAQRKTYEGYENVIYNKSGKSIIADSAYALGQYLALKKGNYWGLFNHNLQEVIAPLYNHISQNGNHFIVNFKNQYGVIDKENNWIIPPLYKSIYPIDDSHYKLVDNYLMEFISDGSQKNEADLYYDFYDEYGIEINTENQSRLISINGDPFTNYKNGVYNGHGNLGLLLKNNSQHLLLNKSGDELFRINDYDTIIFTNDEYLIIQKNNQWGFINEEGILRIANRYDSVRPFFNNRSAIKIRNSWGFINKQEEIVIQPYFQKVSDFENETAYVLFNGKYGVIDLEGNYIIEAEYDEIKKENGFYLLRKASKWGLANKNGKMLSYPSYDDITVEENHLRVKKYNTIRILNLAGNNLIDEQYESIYYDQDQNIFLAKKKSKREQVYLTDILSGKYP